MDYDAIRADGSKESQSVPEDSHLCIVIKSKPIQGVKDCGKDDDDMSYPPEELLMLDDGL